MSVTGILSSAAFGVGAQIFQSRMSQMKTEFQQLGQDLKSGNLSAAQSDFAALQQLRPQASSSTQSNDTITQDFNQLSTDLKAGNTTAAQQDFAKLQQDFQSQSSHHRHHHHSSDSAGSSSSDSSTIAQLFTQLGQALQSGSLSTAQQTYAALQQDFAQFGQSSVSSGVSVST